MEPKSILIVEDEAIIALGIQNDLENLGYLVTGIAYQGEEALQLAGEQHPNLALMDINLRGKLDGIETAVKMRKDYQIPIIFLTGAVGSDTVQRAKAAEPYGYILKPFSRDDLRITLEHALSRAELEFALRQSEARYRELFETSLDGILITDLQGHILDGNPAFRRFMGYEQADLQKRHIIELTPKEYVEEEDKEIGRVLERGFSDEIIKDFYHKDGSRVPASVRIMLRKDPTGRPFGFWGIIRDLTVLQKSQQALQKLARFTELLNAELELPKVLAIICREISQALHCEAIQISLYDAETDTLSIAHTLGPIRADELENMPRHPTLEPQSFGKERAFAIILDAQEDLKSHPYYPFLAKHDVRSVVVANLVREAQLIGRVGLATIGKSRTFDEDEITLLSTMANHAAIAIDRARMYHQAQRRSQELEVVGRLSAALRLANSPQEMLPTLLKEAMRLTQAGAAVIYLFGQPGIPIHTCQSSALPGLDAGWFSPSGALWDRALSIEETLIIDDAGASEAHPAAPAGQGEQNSREVPAIRFRLLVPLRSANTLLALMVLGYAQRRSLDRDDQRVLASLAEMGANALHRSGLMEMLEQRVSDRTRELSALYDLTVFVNSPLGLSEVLTEALRKIVGVFHASIGLFFRYDPDAACLHLETQFDMPARLLPLVNTIPLSGELLQWLETSRSPWLVFQGDASTLPILLPGGDSFETLIIAPVRFEGMTLGLLSVVWLEAYSPTAESIAFLSTAAERLGSAVQNDLLRQKSEHAAVIEERQRLARDLHDSVTQSLYSLTLLAEAGKDLVEREDRARLKKCLDDLSENSIQALKEMRMLLFELRPPQQKEDGLVKAIEDRLEAVERRAGMQTTLVVAEGFNLPAAFQDELYWVAGEALNNALKHAGAKAVEVRLSCIPGGIQMEISDNGKGFNLEGRRAGGIGLSTMRERVERLGGTLEIDSQPGRGTRVTIKIILPVE